MMKYEEGRWYHVIPRVRRGSGTLVGWGVMREGNKRVSSAHERKKSKKDDAGNVIVKGAVEEAKELAVARGTPGVIIHDRHGDKIRMWRNEQWRQTHARFPEPENFHWKEEID